MAESVPTAQRYIDITDCSQGGTLGVNTVKEITYKSKAKRIKDSGDADKGLTFLAKGMNEVEGTVKLADPVQAAALVAAAQGAFVFTGLNPMTSKVLTVTCASALFFDLDGTQKHDDVSGVTVGYQALSVTLASA